MTVTASSNAALAQTHAMRVFGQAQTGGLGAVVCSPGQGAIVCLPQILLVGQWLAGKLFSRPAMLPAAPKAWHVDSK